MITKGQKNALLMKNMQLLIDPLKAKCSTVCFPMLCWNMGFIAAPLYEQAISLTHQYALGSVI